MSKPTPQPLTRVHAVSCGDVAKRLPLSIIVSFFSPLDLGKKKKLRRENGGSEGLNSSTRQHGNTECPCPPSETKPCRFGQPVTEFNRPLKAAQPLRHFPWKSLFGHGPLVAFRSYTECRNFQFHPHDNPDKEVMQT